MGFVVAISCVEWCNKVVSPSSTISCVECKFNFHPKYTALNTISNYNKLGTEKRQWKCDKCLLTQNVTIRKKTGSTLNTDVVTDFCSIQSSITLILSKFKKIRSIGFIF